jgi:hypothetical protein
MNSSAGLGWRNAATVAMAGSACRGAISWSRGGSSRCRRVLRECEEEEARIAGEVGTNIQPHSGSLLVELVGARASQNSNCDPCVGGRCSHSQPDARIRRRSTATHAAPVAMNHSARCPQSPASAGANEAQRWLRCAARRASGIAACCAAPGQPRIHGQPPPEARICDTGKG